MISSSRQITNDLYRNVISTTLNFTKLLLSNLYEYTNSITYLLHYWYKLCIDISRYGEDSYFELRQLLFSSVNGIVKMYIQKRIQDCGDWVFDKEDDALMSVDSLYYELLYIGSISRYQYGENVKDIISLFDDINKQYIVRYFIHIHLKSHSHSHSHSFEITHRTIIDS